MGMIALYLGICMVAFIPSFTAAQTCSMPKNEGIVTDSNSKTIKWYYDAQMEKCVPFLYNGAGGNMNNFKNETNCLKTCFGKYKDLFPEGVGACFLNKERGDCKAAILKWYYNNEKSMCEMFLFSGCHGNGNQFATGKDCRDLCVPSGRGAGGTQEDVSDSDAGTTVAIVFGCLFGIVVVGAVVGFMLQRKKFKKGNHKSKGTTEVEMQ